MKERHINAFVIMMFGLLLAGVVSGSTPDGAIRFTAAFWEQLASTAFIGFMIGMIFAAVHLFIWMRLLFTLLIALCYCEGHTNTTPLTETLAGAAFLVFCIFLATALFPSPNDQGSSDKLQDPRKHPQ